MTTVTANVSRGELRFLGNKVKYFPLGPAIKCLLESSSSILTQKSRLYLRFLNSPPTRAAKWITCVGLFFSKIALVAAESLQ